MSEIPAEDQARIKEFKREEAALAAARGAHQTRREIRAEEAGSRSGPMTADEVISLAANLGWELETGGRHPKLVKGKHKVAIPVHGGSGRNLTTGTLQAILKIIEGEE